MIGHEAKADRLSIRQQPTTILLIEGAKALDPIRVICLNERAGAGRIIIQCYDQAWVAHWGAMGDATIEQFFAGCDAEYLSGNLSCGRRHARQDDAYLLRVVGAVQDALREGLTSAGAAS